MSAPTEAERWAYFQRQWDTDPPEIEHTRACGWFVLHAEPVNEYGDREIHALTDDGARYLGCVYFGAHPQRPGCQEGAPRVHPDYRRRGICRALYDWAAELGGAPMAPAETHSADAAAFWARYGHEAAQ